MTRVVQDPPHGTVGKRPGPSFTLNAFTGLEVGEKQQEQISRSIPLEEVKGMTVMGRAQRGFAQT